MVLYPLDFLLTHPNRLHTVSPSLFLSLFQLPATELEKGLKASVKSTRQHHNNYNGFENSQNRRK